MFSMGFSMILDTEQCKLNKQNIMRKIKLLFLKGGKCHRITELLQDQAWMVTFRFIKKNYNDQGLKKYIELEIF